MEEENKDKREEDTRATRATLPFLPFFVFGNHFQTDNGEITGTGTGTGTRTGTGSDTDTGTGTEARSHRPSGRVKGVEGVGDHNFHMVHLYPESSLGT